MIFTPGASFHRPFFPYPRYGYPAFFGYSYLPAYNYWPSSYLYNPPPSYPPVAVEESYQGNESGIELNSSRELYWLIALRDQAILAVTDYWLEDSTLHYVTRQGTKSSAGLADVDLDFTKELNRERGLEFQLPRPYHPQRRNAYGRPY